MQGWKVYQASNVTDGKWNVKRKQVLGTSIPEQDQWVDSNLFCTELIFCGDKSQVFFYEK